MIADALLAFAAIHTVPAAFEVLIEVVSWHYDDRDSMRGTFTERFCQFATLPEFFSQMLIGSLLINLTPSRYRAKTVKVVNVAMATYDARFSLPTPAERERGITLTLETIPDDAPSPLAPAARSH